MSITTTTPEGRPITDPTIEAVFGDAPPIHGYTTAAPNMLAEWRRFGRFLKRPTIDGDAVVQGRFAMLARVYVLDMIVMITLITLAGMVMAAGVKLPETALSDMELTPGLIALVILGAPIMEELIFRGWLSGKPGLLLTMALFIVVATGFVLTAGGDRTAILAVTAAAVIALIVAIVLLVKWNARPAPRWYARTFPLFFWFSTVAFSLVHIANYQEMSLLVLPLVVPQLVLGALLGYVRVRIGLWSNIALHAAHNATAIALTALSLSVAGEAAIFWGWTS